MFAICWVGCRDIGSHDIMPLMGILFVNLIWLVGAYFLGAIPFSFLIGGYKGVNLLEVGSKSSGATNVYRTLGLKYAVIAFLLDMMKGYVAMWIAYHINSLDNLWVVAAGLAAVVGHTFTPFLNFKGGKGVATGVGLMLFMKPEIAFIGFVLEMAIIAITRYVSLASILSALAIFVMSWLPFFAVIPAYRWLIFVAVAYVIFKHIPNMKRLASGQENKI